MRGFPLRLPHLGLNPLPEKHRGLVFNIFLGLSLLLFPVLSLVNYASDLQNGRVWAEEGLAIARAYSPIPFLELPFFEVAGYLQFANNLTTVLLRWFVPIEQAPLFFAIVVAFFPIPSDFYPVPSSHLF